MKYFSVSQVAKMLGVNNQTIRRHIHAGKLEATQVGSVFRISEEELNKYIGEKK
jgi:excisionase family DNA binding protein